MLQPGVLQPEGDRMTDSAVLDTILGLIFLFYALALLCGGLVEMIANWVKKRAKYLLRGIRDLLDDVVQADVAMPDRKGWMQSTAGTVYLNGMVEKQGYDEVLHAHVPTLPNEPAAAAPTGPGATSPLPGQSMHRNKITLSDVMGHALVQPFRHATSLGKPTRNPSYLPSSVFARTLVDLLTPDLMEPSFADIERGVRALGNSPKLQQSLASIQKSAKGEVDSFLSGTQAWFDGQMDRVTGSYKRWAKRWVIVIAVVVVCVGNLDSIAIARSLYASSAVRAAVVQRASDQNFCSTPADPTKCAEEAANLLERTGIPLGWSRPDPEDGIWGWPLRVLGLLISVGAAALGAPFWYRLLDRIGSLRNTGRPPEPGS
jgi:hypothetical protein